MIAACFFPHLMGWRDSARDALFFVRMLLSALPLVSLVDKSAVDMWQRRQRQSMKPKGQKLVLCVVCVLLYIFVLLCFCVFVLYF